MKSGMIKPHTDHYSAQVAYSEIEHLRDIESLRRRGQMLIELQEYAWDCTTMRYVCDVLEYLGYTDEQD